MSHITNIDLTECEQIAPLSDAVDGFPVAISMLAEQHRPSRMPFFRNLAALDHAAASDPSFLGQIHLVYQAAMHATRAAVYYLPHLERAGRSIRGTINRSGDTIELPHIRRGVSGVDCYARRHPCPSH
jgi:hypothetical protein